LFRSIVLPREIRNRRYATVTIVLRSGDKVVGIRKEEDARSIRVYDTSILPAVLRVIRKADIAKVDSSNESVMPRDYASKYSLRQILDLVAFLKSPYSKSEVTLQSLFQ
jgi:hypothetical protein